MKSEMKFPTKGDRKYMKYFVVAQFTGGRIATGEVDALNQMQAELVASHSFSVEPVRVEALEVVR